MLVANKRRVFHVLADSDHLLLFYFPALLCVFSPALVENGIRYIFVEWASPVTIPGLLANNAQGPEEMCLSLEHRNPSKTSEKWVILIALQFRYTFYRPQTKRLTARKIGLQYKIRKGRKQIWADFRIPETQMELNEIAWFY